MLGGKALAQALRAVHALGPRNAAALFGERFAQLAFRRRNPVGRFGKRAAALAYCARVASNPLTDSEVAKLLREAASLRRKALAAGEDGFADFLRTRARAIADSAFETAASSRARRAAGRFGLRRRTRRPPAHPARNPDLLTISGANPISTAALAAYSRFHGEKGAPVAIRIPRRPGMPRDLVGLGRALAIIYRPRRGHRRRSAWEHKFGADVHLAASADGRQLFVVNGPKGRMHVDFRRGIVH